MIEATYPVKQTLEKRIGDVWGSGEFGAPRGTRTHKGIDYDCPVGAVVHTPVDGKVTKLGYPYSDDLTFRYCEVTDKDSARHRLFYIEPTVKQGDIVQAGDAVGIQQDISGRYRDENKPPMHNHVHYEILMQNGTPINPEGE